MKEDFTVLAMAGEAVDLEEGTLVLFSGKSFNRMPMDMSNSPVPCCSVNGFVNIRYDSSSVTPFLAVVTCV